MSAKIDNKEVFECEKTFNIYRSDRVNRLGGGVLIAVAENLHSYHISHASCLEMVCVCVRINHRDMIFCACYRPPNASLTFCAQLHDVLNSLVVRFPHSPVFLLGDFNFPKILWSGMCPVPSDLSGETSEFINLCTDFNFSQLITQPTRVTASSSNILDLVLTTTPDLVHSLSFLPGLSDHCFVHFTLEGNSHRLKSMPKRIRDYSKANYPAINDELAQFLDEYMQNFSNRTIESNWSIFKVKVNYLVRYNLSLIHI